MANIATVNGNIIEDSGISLVDAPTFPYEPTITHNIGPQTRIVLSQVYASTLYSFFWSFPISGKQYPDPSLNVKIYQWGTFASGTVQSLSATIQAYNQTSSTLNYVEAIYLNASLTISAAQTSLTTISFPNLIYFLSGAVTFTITGNNITTFNFPELKFVAGSITIPASTGITSFSFPKLEVVNGTLTNLGVNVSTYNLPELLEVLGFQDTASTAVTSFPFPKLKIVGTFSISGTKSSLTSISFGALEHITGTFTMPTTSASLSSFTFADTLKSFNSNFVTTSNSLDQSSVDNILIRLAALDGTNGTAAYSSKTVTITGTSATPSAAGLTAKATLQARGCTVTTN